MCNHEVNLDECYRLHELPNNLMFTFRYVETEMEEHMRLRNFMSINLSKNCQKKYMNTDRNPFADPENTDVDCDYTLKTMVCFNDTSNADSSYFTYVKQRDNQWKKYSRTAVTTVDAKEVESVVHPYVLIYERVWSTDRERLEVIKQAQADETDSDKDCM